MTHYTTNHHKLPKETTPWVVKPPENSQVRTKARGGLTRRVSESGAQVQRLELPGADQLGEIGDQVSHFEGGDR